MRIAVLVPAPDYPEPWAWAYDAEAGALTEAGASVEAIAWTEAGELTGYDLVLPLVASVIVVPRFEQAGVPSGVGKT